MSETHLKDGLKLRSVRFPSQGSEEGNYYQAFQSGDDKNYYFIVESITVECQAGHMSRVPWAKVVKQDRSVILVNLAQCEEVTILQPTN